MAVITNNAGLTQKGCDLVDVAHGGVTGICGYPTFISTKARPTMEDMIRMTDYVVDLVGIDHVSIGMDYWFGQAGIAPDEMAQKLYEYLISSGEWTTSVYPPPWWFPEGDETPDTPANLSGALLTRGRGEEGVAWNLGGNWLRVMKEVWG